MALKSASNTRSIVKQNRWTARADDMANFGFGPKAMMGVKVCSHCGKQALAKQNYCQSCGKPLEQQTLLLIYQQMHPCCEKCGTVAPDDAKFCPVCGAQLPRRPTDNQNTASFSRETEE